MLKLHLDLILLFMDLIQKIIIKLIFVMIVTPSYITESNNYNACENWAEFKESLYPS